MRTTINDIARLTGTSPTAVSFVLNGKDHKRVHPAKRQAILDAIEKYGYRRNMAAKGLTMRRAFRIGICVAGRLDQTRVLAAAGHYGLVSQAAARLHESGYGIALLQLDLALPLPEACRRLVREDVDGFLFINFPVMALDRLLFSMAERRIPAISVGAAVEGAHSWVAIDHERSFELGCIHLLDAGLRRLVMLDTDASRVSSEAKRRGYERAMRARGLEPLPTVASVASGARGACDAARAALETVPDVEGILLTDNGHAAVVQMALSGRALRLMGFGDDGPARECDPPISWMSLPVHSVADAAVDHLLRWIDAPEPPPPLQRRFDCALIAPGA